MVGDMGVNESESHRDSPRRRRHLRLLLVIALSLAVALLIGQFLILPMLLRQQIMQALHEAGIDAIRFRVTRASFWGAELKDVSAGDGSAVRIDRIALDYSPGDLKQGRLNAIRVIGATLRLAVKDGQFDLTPLQSLISRRPPGAAPATSRPTENGSVLPLGRIELTGSRLVLLTPKEPVEVPLGGSLVPQSDGRLSVSVQVGEERSLVLGAEVKGTHATFAGSADPGRTLLTVRTIWPDADVSVDGTIKVAGHLDWGDEPAGEARLEIFAPSGTTPPASIESKLHLSAGVYEVSARFGDTNSEPPFRLKVSKAAFAMADQGFSATGIDGDVALNTVSSLVTPPTQKLTVGLLKIGEIEMKDGVLEFQMKDSSHMVVEHTAWKWLGGDVWADHFVISGEPLQITLHAREVELNELLVLTAKEKASGQGKLSGDIPVVIDGSNIQFGTGSIAAATGGNVQIKDMAAIAPTAEAAAQAASATSSDQIKKNVIEALSDFQYDTLAMNLEKTANGGLIGHVKMKGRGRTGAKQPLNYELNVTGLDKVLRGYLRIREGLSSPRVTTTAAPTTARKATP